MRNAIHLLLLMELVAIGAAGCATTQAKAPIERPALEVPPVPDRVIEQPPAPQMAPEPVPELPPVAPNPRPRPPQRDTSKPDPKPETPPVEPPPTTPSPAQPPVPPLRTASSPDTAEAARQISDTRNRAQKLLDDTDYRKLSREQQAQYDDAKRFIHETDEALKTKNFEFAKGVAEKAERLARELQGR
jgi:outer membrane biosynthesis protein TonB